MFPDSFKILYLDDDEDYANLIKEFLFRYENSDKFLFKYINNPHLALKTLNEEAFDLVITDYQMPEMDGIEFYQELRKLSSFNNQTIPVIMATGKGTEEIVLEALGMGFEHYIKKGYNLKNSIDSLINQINRLYEVKVEITQRKYFEGEFQSAKSLIQTMFDNTPALIAYIDSSFNFLEVNKAYAKADEQRSKGNVNFFIGKNHFDLYPDEENRKIFENVLKTGKPFFIYAKPFEYPDGRKQYFDWSLVPTSQIPVKSLVLTITEVTERIHTQLKLEQQLKLEKLLEEQLTRQKNELSMFSSILSHDIRNNIAKIEHYCDLLSNQDLPKTKEFLEKISAQIQILKSILTNSLDLAKEGKIIHEKKPIGIMKIIQTVIDSTVIEPHVKVFISKDEERIVKADDIKLIQLFKNIVENALIHSRTNKIFFKLGTISEGLRLSTVFNGELIDQDIIKKFSTEIFTPGLGLNIIKKIIQAHDWTISYSHVSIKDKSMREYFSGEKKVNEVSIIIPKIDVIT